MTPTQAILILIAVIASVILFFVGWRWVIHIARTKSETNKKGRQFGDPSFGPVSVQIVIPRWRDLR